MTNYCKISRNRQIWECNSSSYAQMAQCDHYRAVGAGGERGECDCIFHGGHTETRCDCIVAINETQSVNGGNI